MSIIQDEVRQPEASWAAQEVVREVDRLPHLVLRVTVRGEHFPHRAMAPYMRIVEGDRARVSAWFTEVAGDSSALLGYFPVDVPEFGILEYGYEEEPPRRVPLRFSAGGVKRLERQRLSGDVVEVTRGVLAEKRRQEGARPR